MLYAPNALQKPLGARNCWKSQSMTSTVANARSQLRGPVRRAARDVLREFVIWPRRIRGYGRHGTLPAFLLVGAAKSGTTSLYQYLTEHPDLEPPIWKAARYFDRYYDRGVAWYRAHFPQAAQGQQTFEASAGYLFHPHAAERIASTIPEAKIVAILRNPIDRAVSQFAHEVRRGGETRSLEAAFAEELERSDDDVPEQKYFFRNSSYLREGLYLPQLERYLEHFPREQLRVLQYEQFFADPDAQFAELLSFLEASPFKVQEFGRHNVGGYSGMTPADRDRLRAFFKPHNEAVAERFGLDISSWN